MEQKKSFLQQYDVLIGYIGIVGIVLTTVQAIIQLFAPVKDPLAYWSVLALSFSLLFIAMLLFFFVRHAKNDANNLANLHHELGIVQNDRDSIRVELAVFRSRMEKLSSLPIDLHTIVDNCRDALLDSEHRIIDERFFREQIEVVKKSFDLLIDHDCSVCLKVFNRANKLETFCRDNRSMQSRRLADYRQRRGSSRQKFQYTVSRNTAFRNIMDGNGRILWYLNNDISIDDGYENERPDHQRDYKSVLVVPIRCFISNKFIYTGFLCVDTKETNAFDETLHPHVLKLVADALQMVFSISTNNVRSTSGGNRRGS